MGELNLPYKKILILENENWSQNKDNGAYMFYEHLLAQGVEFQIIEQAAHKPSSEEIIAAIIWCDAILFASTFTYAWDVKGVGDLLMKVPMSKTVIGYNSGGGNLQGQIERIWSVEELAKMSHHIVFELQYHRYELEDKMDILKPIDMVVYKTEWDRLEAEKVLFNHSFKPTGQKILVGTILAFGEQWSCLKTGDIVDELDCSTIDNQPGRGVWVMGKDEPVKLLNDDRYEEFQFAELTAANLTHEFFSRGGNADKEDLMVTVESWIYHALGKMLNEEDGMIELHEWCDNLCKIVGVERRGNRSYFEKRLLEYHKKFTYFKEGRNDPRERELAKVAGEKRKRRDTAKAIEKMLVKK